MDYADVSVVMITLNEEGAIAKVIGDAQATLPGAEVIVVDGSSDATPEIAARLGARVIREPPGGPAPALLAALQAPERPIVVSVDADDTYPAEVYPELVRRIRDGDDVAGTDRLGRRPPKTMPLPNWFANIAFNVIASVRTRRRLLDVHTGQRAYRRSLIDEFDWDTSIAAFPVDLLLWPARAGCRVSEIRIEYRDRIGNTTLVRWPGTKATLKRLFRRSLSRRAARHPAPG
ncbi:MAG TPA: glycosyltransferase family 2 protein [Acidimicrobiales bacterium]|nr:glycosyltransferase family 2 protein [Acidimicrobiales bacterium]